MGIEIEKKYLVKKEIWQRSAKGTGSLYRQGYLLTDPDKTMRVRIANQKGYLTIKGKQVGPTRLEYEYEIPEKDARELLGKFTGSEIIKIRYKVTYSGKVWEVDEFEGDNSGLIIAEIELKHDTEPYDLPPWVGAEITSEMKYTNSSLSKNPFNLWKSE